MAKLNDAALHSDMWRLIQYSLDLATTQHSTSFTTRSHNTTLTLFTTRSHVTTLTSFTSQSRHNVDFIHNPQSRHIQNTQNRRDNTDHSRNLISHKL